MPARGLLSTPSQDSSKIMVNTMWDYPSEADAEIAENEMQVLIQFLNYEETSPDMIRNWDVERLNN